MVGKPGNCGSGAGGSGKGGGIIDSGNVGSGGGGSGWPVSLHFIVSFLFRR